MILLRIDLRHRIAAGIAVATLCTGMISEVSAHLPEKSGTHNAAERAFTRLEKKYSVESLQEAFGQRSSLSRRSVTVRFTTDGPSQDLPSVRIALSEHPDWIVFDRDKSRFTISERSVRYYLDDIANGLFPRPSDAVAFPLDGESARIRIEGEPRDGYTVNIPSTARAIASALFENAETVSVPLTFQAASVHLLSPDGTQRLTRLSKGLSDFAKSPYGREANIRRALATYLDGIVIGNDQEFSFNQTMSNSFGWREALVIGEGGTLVQEPGGGICQAASTVFRAALLAGLPIIERANHSLYVGYYEEYGVGLDATMYPGKQDLIFRNDTGAPMIIAARSDGTKAIVELYGKPDGRTVNLEGPFFSTSNDGYEKKLSIRQIGWQYSVTHTDGRTHEKSIVSTYTMLPKAIRAKYADAQGIELLSELMPNADAQVTMR